MHNTGPWVPPPPSRVVEEGRDKGRGFAHSVEKLYTEQDAADFGEFELVPCLRGQVRITKPALIHGSTASTGQRTRRTILPWYVAVQNCQ